MKSPISRSVDLRFVLWFIFAVPLFFPGIFSGKLPGSLAPGLSDTYVFFEPYTLSFYHSILRFENPFWDHQSSFGAPVLLTLGAGSLHPFHLLHLALPDAFAFCLGVWARFALFGTFSFLYLRQCRVDPWIAAAAVTSLVYGSFFLNYANDIIGYVVVFFPFCLYCIERIQRELSLMPLIGLAFGIFGLILGGFLSVIMYLLLALFAYVLVHIKRPITFFWIGFFGLTGVMLTLPALIEIFDFFPQSGFDPEKRRSLFFYTPNLTAAFNLFFPSQFGDIVQYRAAGHRDFYGNLLGAGVLTTLIALMGTLFNWSLFRRLPERATFWSILLIFCLCAYFNIGNIKSGLVHIPLINQHPLTRLQTLIAISSTFASALLMNQWLQATLNQKARQILAFTLIFFLIGIFSAYSIKIGFNYYTILFSTLAVVLTLILLTVIFKYPHSKWLWLIGAVATGLFTSQIYTHYIPYKAYYARSKAIQIVEQHLVRGARVLDVNNILFGQTSIAYSIASLTSHWFTPEPMRQLIRQTSDEPVAKALTFETLPSLSSLQPWPALRRMHVQIVALSTSVHKPWLDKKSNDWRIIYTDPEKDLTVLEVLTSGISLSPAGFSGEGYRNYLEGAGKISLLPAESLSTQPIIVPVRMYRGWTSLKGAAPLESDANGFIKITPNGTGEPIELRYFPPHFWRSAFLGIGILFIGIVMFRKFNPRSHTSRHHAES